MKSKRVEDKIEMERPTWPLVWCVCVVHRLIFTIISMIRPSWIGRCFPRAGLFRKVLLELRTSAFATQLVIQLFVLRYGIPIVVLTDTK
eukprot:5528391-Amphidinium_carterae.1